MLSQLWLQFVIGTPMMIPDMPVTLTDGQMRMSLSIEDNSAGRQIIKARRRDGRSTEIPHNSLFWTEFPLSYARSSQRQLWRFLRRRFANEIAHAQKVYGELKAADRQRQDDEATLARARTKMAVPDEFDSTAALSDQLDSFSATVNECRSFTASCLVFGGESGRYVLFTTEGPIFFVRDVKSTYATLTLVGAPNGNRYHRFVDACIRINPVGPEVSSMDIQGRNLLKLLRTDLVASNLNRHAA